MNRPVLHFPVSWQRPGWKFRNLFGINTINSRPYSLVVVGGANKDIIIIGHTKTTISLTVLARPPILHFWGAVPDVLWRWFSTANELFTKIIEWHVFQYLVLITHGDFYFSFTEYLRHFVGPTALVLHKLNTPLRRRMIDSVNFLIIKKAAWQIQRCCKQGLWIRPKRRYTLSRRHTNEWLHVWWLTDWGPDANRNPETAELNKWFWGNRESKTGSCRWKKA